MSDTNQNAAETTPETTTAADAADQAPQQPAGDATDAGLRATLLEAEVASLKDQLLRTLADAENARRRAQKEREDTAKYAVSGFAKDLLAVADNLRRALESVPEEARQGNDQVTGLLTGVEATERQLLAAFERAGIKKMEPMGEPFDPNFHQVMMEMEGTGKPAGSVVQVLQAGYTIHGRLLREAIVGVAKGGGDGKVNTSA
ncbi:MAG TPA: nucleotide exchange factor GrpE [Azospirillaceae bacterium]|nr:nucleotide exchange factor GrpE [Azospirillaceae bacterium]